MIRSEEHHQGDVVVYGFSRSLRGGWSKRGADRWRKVEKFTTCRIRSIESPVFGQPICPETQYRGFRSQHRAPDIAD